MDIRMIRGGAVIAVAVLAACSSGATAPPTPTQANLKQNVLQFAVGTATLPGGVTGMNVLTTFRQPNGLSATLLNQPVVTGPFTMSVAASATVNSYGATIGTGPSSAEIKGTAPGCTAGSACIAGSPQVPPGSPASAIVPTTFGEGGGVFSTGFAPFNSNTSGSNYGAYTPFAIPYYAGKRGATIVPLGGPPAYDPAGSGKGTRTGSFSSNVLGVDMGISVFQGVTPSAGTYTLTALIPTTSGSPSFSATTSLGAVTPLAPITAPVLTIPGDGTATVAYTLPGGVTGAYVQVVDAGGCNGTTYYTQWVTASGTFSITNATAPQGATHAICTLADNVKASAATGTADETPVLAEVIGFDYNHYALTDNGALNATYPQKPALPAKADISLSPQASVPSP